MSDISSAPREDQAPRTVLVVDDEANVRELMADYLRARGFAVVEAENGLEALLKFRLVRPQAVVLDLLMPRLGGLRALKRIRAFDRNVVVVAVTGAMDEELRKQVLASGVTAILAKPLRLSDLWSALGGDDAGADGPARRTGLPSVPSPEPALPGGAAGRVLIVDDDPDFGATLEEYVVRQGCEARLAADGDSALRLIRADPPDVVLLDVHMAGLSGLDALEAILEAAPGVQVIMVSGAASYETAKESLAHGAFDFIAKPPDRKSFAQALQAALLMKRLDVEWRVGPAAGDARPSGSAGPGADVRATEGDRGRPARPEAPLGAPRAPGERDR
jgi:DNA-binding NtrC family response regulator